MTGKLPHPKPQTSGTSKFGEISTALVCRAKKSLRLMIEQTINVWKRWTHKPKVTHTQMSSALEGAAKS